jgi:hypothetical protein
MRSSLWKKSRPVKRVKAATLPNSASSLRYAARLLKSLRDFPQWYRRRVSELRIGQYLAEEIYLGLPLELRTLSYAAVQNDSDLAAKYSLPLDSAMTEAITNSLPLTVPDSLQSYGLIGKDDEAELEKFICAVLEAYIDGATAPAPEYTPETQASECEICAREHLPLTYHHLIPRQVADKAVKRGWHADWEVNKVAWLCRACHSYVHKILSNEELARDWYSIELLIEREDVQRWAQWVSKVRWKAR